MRLLLILAVLLAAPALHAETRARKAPIVAGAITLGVTYSVTVSFTTLNALGKAGHSTDDERSYATAMFVPVVGPWISLGFVGTRSNASSHRLIAITSGTLQAVGLGLILWGIFDRQSVVPTVSLVDRTIGLAGRF